VAYAPYAAQNPFAYVGVTLCANQNVGDAVYECSVTTTLAVGNRGGTWQHIPTQSSFGWSETVNDTRLIGQSVHVKNLASDLLAAGDIAEIQLPLKDHWMNYVTNTVQNAYAAPTLTTGYGGIDALADSFPTLAKTGSYMWRKPASDDWSAWLNETDQVNGQAASLRVDLQAMSPFLVWTCSVPLAAQTMRVTVASAIEAVTTDTSREQRPAEGDPIDLLRLQTYIRHMKQYSENPLHWDMIWQNIKSAVATGASAVARYGPAVLAGAAGLGKFVAGL